MPFKMLRVNENVYAGLNAKGDVVLNHLFWRDEDGEIVDAVLSQDDCRAIGEFVSSGKINESRADQPQATPRKP